MSKKIIFALACALCLIVSGTNYVNAAELPVAYSSENEYAVPRTTAWYIALETGSTKTSSTTENFSVLVRAYGLFGNINVSEPCIIYVSIRDKSTGAYLGTTSFNITYAGSFNFNLSPSSLNSGSYELSYWFNKAGISYTFIPQGYTAN